MATFRIGIKVVLLLGLTLISYVAKEAFGAPNRGPVAGIGVPITIFNVLSFGAKPDGRKDNTQAFMKAWLAACHWRGRAMLVIPTGKFLVGQVSFEGPCNSPISIIVQVKGTLLAQTDISEYPSPEWITFDSINGLILTGGGTFDGQGSSVWEYNDCHQNKECQMLPTNLKFSSVTNGKVRGINSINSKAFHIGINRCENFRAHDLHITAPEDSPNTDGVHISSSNGVRISRSVIKTGDDCISIGQGSVNVSISKIICGPGHGISVGSLGKYPDEKDVRGIIVRNCTLTNTDNGVRIKTWPGSPPSQASSFIFQDIIMNNARNPIIIDQEYCSSSSCNNKPSRVKISNVNFRNIKGSSASDVAVSILCSPQFPCQNVNLFDINLKYSSKRANSMNARSTCSNAKMHFGGLQNPPPCR